MVKTKVLFYNRSTGSSKGVMENQEQFSNSMVAGSMDVRHVSRIERPPSPMPQKKPWPRVMKRHSEKSRHF